MECCAVGCHLCSRSLTMCVWEFPRNHEEGTFRKGIDCPPNTRNAQEKNHKNHREILSPRLFWTLDLRNREVRGNRKPWPTWLSYSVTARWGTFTSHHAMMSCNHSDLIDIHVLPNYCFTSLLWLTSTIRREFLNQEGAEEEKLLVGVE